ncbi:Agd3-related carbohydrate-binding protein [Amycolatopsis aidingensis]|uniref:Agd3-related carbohydrate-binding protein n=1 Tax=Amycolatopsis aidingensis TaxID=2842453 RepID=UPI001C0DCCAF|nr:hypothetical protein [Amycolatopsis aidingensis]
MRARTTADKSMTPALLVLALALTAITVLSPGAGDPATGGEAAFPAALPAQPEPARIQRVPVRAQPVSPGPAAPGSRVALRQLVIATDPEDVGLPVWRAVLDRIGTPYDVHIAGSERLDRRRLVRPDGAGRYSAILLTGNGLLRREPDGGYRSGLTPDEWQALWEYERTFQVRQVALNTAPGTEPEDYCLRAVREQALGREAEHATLPRAGAELFDYLRPDVRLPIQRSYVYRTTQVPGCAARPILELGGDVLGVLSTAPDGRQRAALTFLPGPEELATDLLGYGLLRWATRGVFLGERRHWINVDVDDWFNTTLRRRADGRKDSFRLDGADAAAAARGQRELRERHPLAGDFRLNLPYNGGSVHSEAPAQCSAEATPDPLTSYSRCLAGEFRWINHTLTHPAMDFTDYQRNRSEIRRNLNAAAAIGLPVPTSVLKTPEYSGLGVYNPDPKSLEPATDHGLEKSNRALLRAASELGVRYLHGDLSYAGHQPDCFNCGIPHPLRPELFVVPDWPTGIGFAATTPAEQAASYNAAHGTELGYREIVAAEAGLALRHLASGSAYAHTLHQGNLHAYDGRHSLTFDWLAEVLTRYGELFAVPLKNPEWTELARYVEARNAHFAELDAGADAVWDRTSGAVTLSPETTGSMFLTGLETREATAADQDSTDRAEWYGSDPVSRLGVTARETVTLTASPRS